MFRSGYFSKHTNRLIFVMGTQCVYCEVGNVFFKFRISGFQKPAICLLPGHHILVSQKSVRLLLLFSASHQVCCRESLSIMPAEHDLL